MKRIHVPGSLRSTLAGAGAAFMLAACAVGPDYSPPSFEYADGWIDPVESPTRADAAWWQGFDDPVLEGLVAAALENNRNLQLAVERITEARTLRDVAGSRLYPQAAAAASVNRRRLSENGALPAGRIPGLDVQQTIYDAGFDASWEFDLFGAIRGRLRSASALVDAQRARATELSLSIVADVARNYFELRSLVGERSAAGRGREAAAALADIARARVRAGEATPADVAAAKAALARAEALLPPLDAAIRTRLVALTLLKGEAPAIDTALLDPDAALPALSEPGLGTRQDVLRLRPDVVAAERRLAAAAAEVGVATAGLLPSIGLTAAGGFESLDTGRLFDSASSTWSVLPRIAWRLFDGGERRANLGAAESRARQAALAYEHGVLAALTDIEQKRAAYRGANGHLERQRAVLTATRVEFDLVARRHAAGDVSKSQLLMAESKLRDAQRSLAAAHGEALVRLVALYKSLGGRAANGEALAAR